MCRAQRGCRRALWRCHVSTPCCRVCALAGQGRARPFATPVKPSHRLRQYRSGTLAGQFGGSEETVAPAQARVLGHPDLRGSLAHSPRRKDGVAIVEPLCLVPQARQRSVGQAVERLAARTATEALQAIFYTMPIQRLALAARTSEPRCRCRRDDVDSLRVPDSGGKLCQNVRALYTRQLGNCGEECIECISIHDGPSGRSSVRLDLNNKNAFRYSMWTAPFNKRPGAGISLSRYGKESRCH